LTPTRDGPGDTRDGPAGSRDGTAEVAEPIPLLTPADGLPDVVRSGAALRDLAAAVAAGHGPIAVDAEGPLHQRPVEGVVRGRIGERGDPGHQSADQVGGAEETLAEGDAVLLRLEHLGAQHQLGEVHRELVGRDVRTLGEAELAPVTELNHPLLVLVLEEADRVLGGDGHVLEQFGRFVLLHDLPALDVLAFRLFAVWIQRVHPPEEDVERGAEVEAQPAPVADLEDPVQLRLEMARVPELRVVVRHPVRVAAEVGLIGDRQLHPACPMGWISATKIALTTYKISTPATTLGTSP